MSVFTPQQLLAMVLTKLVDIANSANGGTKNVADVVLSVPAYFTDAQRHAMLDASRIAVRLPLPSPLAYKQCY